MRKGKMNESFIKTKQNKNKFQKAMNSINSIFNFRCQFYTVEEGWHFETEYYLFLGVLGVLCRVLYFCYNMLIQV